MSWKWLKSRTVWGGFLAMLAPVLSAPELGLTEGLAFLGKLIMLVGAREAIRPLTDK